MINAIVSVGALAALMLLKGLAVMGGGVKLLRWKRSVLHHRGAGIALWSVAVGWTLWEVARLGPSDFGNFKGALFVVFAGLGAASVWLLKDYLLVRAAAVVWLYISWWLLKAVYLLPGWEKGIYVAAVYAIIVACLWLTVAPWRARQWMDWLIAHPRATRTVGACYAALGLVLAWVATRVG